MDYIRMSLRTNAYVAGPTSLRCAIVYITSKLFSLERLLLELLKWKDFTQNPSSTKNQEQGKQWIQVTFES